MTPADRESGNAEWGYQVVDGGGVISRQLCTTALTAVQHYVEQQEGRIIMCTLLTSTWIDR